MEIKLPGSVQKDSAIAIVGAGTWGTSIAYQLAKRGYTNITVFDSYQFPSAVAAGNDVNKILEEASEPPSLDLDDQSYAWAVIDYIATKIWKEDPVYSPYYHNTGFIYAAVGDEAYGKVRESCQSQPDLYEPLKNAAAFKATSPNGVLTGDFEGWRGFIRRDTAGWVEARDTILDVHTEAIQRGVRFICDPIKGKVSQLTHGESGDVVGVLTADGRRHSAHTTVLAAGASSSLLLDFEKQLRPTAWTLAHIALTEDEVSSGAYNELPVLYGVDKGFFISPPKSEIAAGTPEVKICNEHPGFINLVSDPLTGEQSPVPLQRNAIPLPAASDMRDFLRGTAPQLAERALLRPRLCWDADTPDRLFLLSRHPRHPSLFVAAGGSGNGFVCSPAVGVLVADLIEGHVEDRLQKALGWRPETAVGRDWFDTQGRFGGTGKVVDLKVFGDDEWTNGSHS
ncbi:L-saccharopine oxidase 3 [Seiridium cupressi]